MPEPATARDGGLAARVIVAAMWMVGLRFTDRLIGLASMAILARLLMPEDFGVVAYATLVIGLLDLLTAMSTDAELIRHPAADRAYFCAAWSLNILRGLAIAVAILVLTVPAVRFFAEPRLAGIMLALAAVPLISGLENVGMVEYRKELRFDREFRLLLGARLAGVSVSLAVAYVHRNHWSLVFGVLAQTVFRVASTGRTGYGRGQVVGSVLRHVGAKQAIGVVAAPRICNRNRPQVCGGWGGIHTPGRSS